MTGQSGRFLAMAQFFKKTLPEIVAICDEAASIRQSPCFYEVVGGRNGQSRRKSVIVSKFDVFNRAAAGQNLPHLRPDLKGNGRDQPPIVSFLGMGGAAIGIESLRIRIGAMAGPFGHAHTSSTQTA